MGWWVVAAACAVCIGTVWLANRQNKNFLWVTAALCHTAALVALFCFEASAEQFVAFAAAVACAFLALAGRKGGGA